MTTCPRCSAVVSEAHRFCPSCGAATAIEDATQAPGPDPTRTSAPAAPAHSSSPPSAASSGLHGRFEPGTRLGSRYRIVALLGRGGMGEVYRADDLELGQGVALKFLPQALARNAADLARFRSEVRVARQIAHQNVCRVYDIGEADDNVFLSMEYIDGEDLASVLRRMGRPSTDKAIEIARQICLGLAAAHDAGMLHRDMKPANIMIDGRGRVRITDFGLAGLAEELARDGDVAGTPAYMAPEQLTGGRASVRSDLYALGLVLYEVFTGKRVFATNNFAELRRLHESGSMTTPSQLVRDLDPAVERIILHCLEHDPEQRPPSAYAVLGALPGADPLAAALAAGETPSPELVANAGERGTMSPGSIAALVAGGLAAMAIYAGILGPDFKALTQPTEVLAVRAGDILARTGAFSSLPRHTAEGFAVDQAYYDHLTTDTSERSRGAKPFYFWRRWAPQTIEALSIHAEAPFPNNPPLGRGEATVLLDPAGRLVGLRAIPADSTPPAQPIATDWAPLFRAAGLDVAAFTPVPVKTAVPPECETAGAWTGTLPWAGAEPVTVVAGASRGRPVFFSLVHDWGASTAPIDRLAREEKTTLVDWMYFLLISGLPFAASIYFAVRNLRYGRGDRKGATRIALFVLAMNLLESAFTIRLSEEGLLSVGWDWVSGRGLAHSLLHAVSMWFAYVALEPYLRRLWPRMLVSSARLVSGRVRDPLVGRDLLVGALGGTVLIALETVVQYASLRYGHGRVPTLVGAESLVAATSVSLAAYNMAYSASMGVLLTLRALMLVLVLRLLVGRTWPAVALCTLLLGANAAFGFAQTAGWLVATLAALAYYPGVFFVLMRFGLLPGAITVFVEQALNWSVATLDFSSWYADRALVPMALLLALVGYGAWTALGGVPILGDPLGDARVAQGFSPARRRQD